MTDPQSAVISQLLADYNSFIMEPTPHRSDYENAAANLLAAFKIAISDTSNDNLMTLWNFFTVNQNTTLQEGPALYGVTAMTQSDRALYTLVYTMFRQATNGLQPTTTGDALAILVDAPIVVQFLEMMALTAVVGSEQLSGVITLTEPGTLAPIPPNTILGNPGTASAVPVPVVIGAGLSMTAEDGLVATGGGGGSGGSDTDATSRILWGVGDPTTLPPDGGYIYLRTDLTNTFASTKPVGPTTIVQTVTMTYDSASTDNVYAGAAPADGNILIALETTTSGGPSPWNGWSVAANVAGTTGVLGGLVLFHYMKDGDFMINGSTVLTTSNSNS